MSVGGQAGIIPDHQHHRNVDDRENVHDHARDRQHAQKGDQERRDRGGIGAAQSKADERQQRGCSGKTTRRLLGIRAGLANGAGAPDICVCVIAPRRSRQTQGFATLLSCCRARVFGTANRIVSNVTVGPQRQEARRPLALIGLPTLRGGSTSRRPAPGYSAAVSAQLAGAAPEIRLPAAPAGRLTSALSNARLLRIAQPPAGRRAMATGFWRPPFRPRRTA